MKKDNTGIILAFILAVGYLLTAQITAYTASITDGYPGYPNNWDGLTTNTIIEIKLDNPVAMVGDPPIPDMEYCVKKYEFSGLDFVFTDVSCDLEVSADRKTINLYPNDVLDENGLFAYKIIDINLQGGGSQQNFAKYFETGDNPTPAFSTELEESDMCDDEGGDMIPLQISNWCYRCHTDWKELLGLECTIAP